MEEFFYLILIVVWLIISVFKQKSKKSQQARPKAGEQTKTPPPPGSELGDLLEDFFGTGSQKKEAEETKRQEAVPSAHKAEPYQEYEPSREVYGEEIPAEEPFSEYKEYAEWHGVKEDYEFSSDAALRSAEENLKREMDGKTVPKTEPEEVFYEPQEEETLDFDLKKAVIYSEILNRKYT